MSVVVHIIDKRQLNLELGGYILHHEFNGLAVLVIIQSSSSCFYFKGHRLLKVLLLDSMYCSSFIPKHCSYCLTYWSGIWRKYCWCSLNVLLLFYSTYCPWFVQGTARFLFQRIVLMKVLLHVFNVLLSPTYCSIQSTVIFKVLWHAR